MTFEGQYLTYAEYTELGGSAIGEMPFNLLEFEARRRIDIRTQNRLKDVDSGDIPQEVKLCEYNLINSINGFASAMTNISNNGNVASFNSDGYSESYITPAQIQDVVKSKSAELDDIVRTYLLGVIFNDQHLMYLGVD
jgi:hypothetical protein